VSEKDDYGRLPTPDEPLNAPPRRGIGPLALTLVLLGLLALVFLAIMATTP
jgi:hypothetical protein